MEEDSNYNEQVVLMDRIKDTISYQNKYTKWWMAPFMIMWMVNLFKDLYPIDSTHQWDSENIGKLCFDAVLVVILLVSIFMSVKYVKAVSQSETPVKLLAAIDKYNKKTYLYMIPLGVVFLLSLYFWLDDLMVFLILAAALVFLFVLIYLLNRNRYDDIKRLRELVGQVK